MSDLLTEITEKRLLREQAKREERERVKEIIKHKRDVDSPDDPHGDPCDEGVRWGYETACQAILAALEED